MNLLQQFIQAIRLTVSNNSFLRLIRKLETSISKVLAVAMIGVVLLVITEVCLFLFREILFNNNLIDPDKFFTASLLSILGLFLNVLIALEVLENITAYLRKHAIQLELVIVTCLTAVARKIIIFDLSQTSGLDLIALALAMIALAISYWLIRLSRKHRT